MSVWSISLTNTGIGACILNTDMTYHHFSAPYPVFRQDRCWCVETNAILHVLGQTLEFLINTSDQLPESLAICTPDREMACFVNDHRHVISPFYLSLPPILPKHDIPEMFQDDPDISSAYRQSLLRNIQQFRPEFGLNEKIGIYSPGAWISQILTGNPVDTCMPVGVPESFPEFDPTNQSMFYKAMGLDPSLNQVMQPTGLTCGNISPDGISCFGSDLSTKLKKIIGIPVFIMGSSQSALSYATAADPLNWSVSLSWKLHTGFNAERNAFNHYEISIHDQGLNAVQHATQPDLQNLTRNEWAQLINDHLPFRKSAGTRSTLSYCSLETDSAHSPLFNHSNDFSNHQISAEDFLRIPVGSYGLHFIYHRDSWQIIGLKPSHDIHAFYHALFEGQLYHLLEWQQQLPSKPESVRIILNNPWPSEAIQCAANCLQIPVLIPDDSAEILAALGAALGLMRDLHNAPGSSPSIHAQIIEPQTSSYEAHFRVHCALRQMLVF